VQKYVDVPGLVLAVNGKVTAVVGLENVGDFVASSEPWQTKSGVDS